MLSDREIAEGRAALAKLGYSVPRTKTVRKVRRRHATPEAAKAARAEAARRRRAGSPNRGLPPLRTIPFDWAC